MALSKKTTTYVITGVAVLGGLYLVKRKLLSTVGQAQASNNAAIVQHVQNAAALVAAKSLSGMGDAAVTTPTPPAALLVTGANLTEVATIIQTTVAALGGVVTLILGYLALEEKRRTLYVKKD